MLDGHKSDDQRERERERERERDRQRKRDIEKVREERSFLCCVHYYYVLIHIFLISVIQFYCPTVLWQHCMHYTNKALN